MPFRKNLMYAHLFILTKLPVKFCTFKLQFSILILQFNCLITSTEIRFSDDPLSKSAERTVLFTFKFIRGKDAH